MEQKMFCYQCEQTAGCIGCTGSRGVCGKTAQTAKLQDELTGALIGLARATVGDTLATEETWNVMITGLFATLTNVSFDDAAIREQIAAVHRAKDALVPQCQSCGAPCGRNDDYDLRQLWEEPDEDIRSLKSLILFGLRGMAAYAYHAMVLGYRDAAIDTFFSEALCKVGEAFPMEELLQTALKVGEVNLQCMALLDKANTETFGTPSPKTVSMKIEKGPFIVVTGHDLRDLQLLLEQTKDKGISIYTHGEMLPATECVSAFKGQLWHSMAEPAERICRFASTDSFYHQLFNAAEGQLCRPSVYNRSGCFSGCGTHRGRKRLYATD